MDFYTFITFEKKNSEIENPNRESKLCGRYETEILYVLPIDR